MYDTKISRLEKVQETPRIVEYTDEQILKIKHFFKALWCCIFSLEYVHINKQLCIPINKSLFFLP